MGKKRKIRPGEELNEEEIVELLIKAAEELPEKCKIIFL